MKKSNLLKIGELARLTDLSNDTIRFYESKGLLTPSERSDAGYRLYSADDVEKLLFIQRTKTVGFTLNEISELMELKLHPDTHTCGEVKKVTEQKLQQVTAKINELERIRQSLLQMNNLCDGGPESAQHCTILQLLDSEKPL